jgi:hypothetical protein
MAEVSYIEEMILPWVIQGAPRQLRHAKQVIIPEIGFKSHKDTMNFSLDIPEFN